MSLIIQAAEKLLAAWQYQPRQRTALEFIATGSETFRQQIPALDAGDIGEQFDSPVVSLLPAPSAIDDPGWRLVEVLARFAQYFDLGKWLGPFMLRGEGEEYCQSILVEAFSRAGRETPELIEAIVDRFPLERADGEPTSAGRWLLAQTDEDLLRGVRRTHIPAGEGLLRLVEFLRRQCPQRLEVVGPVIVAHPQGRIPERACLALLESTGTRFVEPLFLTWNALDNCPENTAKRHPAKLRAVIHDDAAATKLALGFSLAQVQPQAFREPVHKYALKILQDPSALFERSALGDIAAAVVRQGKPEYVEALKVWLCNPHRCGFVLKAVVERGGAEAAPILRAALDLPLPELRLPTAARLVDLGLEEEAVERTIQTELAGAAPLAGFVTIAARWRTAAFADSLWKLLGNKSNPVREAALRGVSRLGVDMVSRALKLLGARKAMERDAAVRILLQSGDLEALRALEAHAETETDDAVRDRILLALESARGPLTAGELSKRIERSLLKIASLPAPWIRLEAYPPLQWQDGARLNETAVRYLLYRQSRAKEMSADIEAKAVYARIDKATSGAFALSFLNHFLGGPQSADDRWALALAALLGDDRLVGVLNRQIAEWARSSRGKMAEYAVRALALMGSQAALSAVNVLSIRYATQFRNVGKAAAEAFEAAAEAQGTTAGELGDRVVPAFGLPRTETVGGKAFELDVDLEGKFALRDAASKKKAAALPKAAPADLVETVKQLKAALKEVWKGQLARQEGLMVGQMRWPVDRWRELYLAHPVLFPFAVRLVWGWYDGAGNLKATFRAMEDRTLTTADDEEFQLPGSGSTGIVHPLELSEESLGQWSGHLADYAVIPPFPQLARPVVRFQEDQAALRQFTEVEGTGLNALTFRGRAEKLGWQRGSVCDAGGIRFYHKRFPASGAEAFVELEDMYMGAGMDAFITLGNAFFVRLGSVETGSYVYDEPESMDDARVLAFRDVPPIAFSETLGDLVRIAGTSKARDGMAQS